MRVGASERWGTLHGEIPSELCGCQEFPAVDVSSKWLSTGAPFHGFATGRRVAEASPGENVFVLRNDERWRSSQVCSVEDRYLSSNRFGRSAR